MSSWTVTTDTRANASAWSSVPLWALLVLWSCGPTASGAEAGVDLLRNAYDDSNRPVPGTISLVRSPFVFGAGGVGSSMDAMPFYHDGRWHLLLMQTAPQGIAHRVSTDLVNWQVRPIAVPGPAATGTVLEHQGTFYFFYTSGQTAHVAMSKDLDDWTPYEGNPVATADGRQYVGPDFRDPYVFYNEAESCWWMLITTRIPGRHPIRAGCIGVYKSHDLLHWEAAEPLWAPSLNPHHECPQVIQHQGRWYLFHLPRQTSYRFAESLHGPWLRPPIRDLGSVEVLTGSRVACDGQKWVSIPFICARQDNQDFGEVVQAEVFAIPRQLDFHDDGSITERPVDELIQAMHALPPVDPLAGATTIAGAWDLKDRSATSADTGTLLLNEVPSDCYFEADVTLGTRNMEAAILLRAAADLNQGYRLELRPDEGMVTFRPFSYWDRDRVLASQRLDLPVGTPFKVRVFVSGTVMEAFVGDRVVLSSRVYRHPQGLVALVAAEGKAIFDNIIVRRLYGDNHEADVRHP